jgi:hypothetical protein
MHKPEVESIGGFELNLPFAHDPGSDVQKALAADTLLNAETETCGTSNAPLGRDYVLCRDCVVRPAIGHRQDLYIGGSGGRSRGL